MAGSIIMPKSGMAMEEGVIIQWLKKEGDKVEKGEPLLEVETDKSTMEVESDFSGTLLKILYNDGDTVPVTEVIGWVGEEGEPIPETAEKPAAAEPETAEPAPEPSSGRETPPEPAAEPLAVQEGGRIKATPAARRIAQEKGLSLGDMKPGGRHGEVRAADVASAELSGPVLPASGEAQRIKLTNIQRVTGKRMLQSCIEIPMVTVNSEADVTELLAMRENMNARGNMRITINDFVLKVVVRALEKNPRLNASIEGDELLLFPFIHLGVAAATDRGLLVPVIHNAEKKSLGELSTAMKEIRQKAEEGSLSTEDLTGSTFTVSNIGKFGVTSFTPIINQPEAAILGVCAVKDRLVRSEGEIVDRKFMGLSLTFDHRIVDGAESAEFMQSLVEMLENPVLALV